MPDLPQILSTQLSMPPYALVVDDHPLVAEGMAQVLMTSASVRQVRCAAHGNEALAVIAALGEPAITVMDFWLEDGASLEFVHSILALAPGTRILVTSGDKHPAIASKAAAAGVHGFVHKSSTAQVFQMAVQALLSGRSWFEALPPIPAAPPASAAGSTLSMSARELGITARQSQVLSLLLQGKPNRAIAQALNLSEYTVKEHVTALLQRLGATNRVALITRMRGIEVDLY